MPAIAGHLGAYGAEGFPGLRLESTVLRAFLRPAHPLARLGLGGGPGGL